MYRLRDELWLIQKAVAFERGPRRDRRCQCEQKLQRYNRWWECNETIGRRTLDRWRATVCRTAANMAKKSRLRRRDSWDLNSDSSGGRSHRIVDGRPADYRPNLMQFVLIVSFVVKTREKRISVMSNIWNIRNSEISGRKAVKIQIWF